MTPQENKKVPERKLKAVEEFKNLANTKKTILIASIKNLPASQFQEISKKLRGKAVVKVPKKSISLRAIEAVEKDSVKKIKENIDKDIAILFSDLDAFELDGELINNRSAAKAKPGQEAPEDIEVQEGPTDLVPGPAVSELGALGIQIKIENGKIKINANKIIAKQGEKISQGAADLMSKLDIKPFEVGFEPLVALDTQSGTLYTDIKIDREGTLEELKVAFGKALPFAVEIGYICEDTIKFLISKAGMHEKALDGLGEKEKTEAPEPEEKKEEVAEEVKKDTQPEIKSEGETK
ncbi:MAG: 50S ribosomal protein L10 [Pirellulales bacterium]|nr:50S ribosomal protein L10 [Pirellulales bacterium]